MEAVAKPPSEQHKRQRVKNLVLVSVLLGLVLLFYFISIAKMSGGAV